MGNESKSLDQDMNTAFDSLNVLNAAMTAIMQSLPPDVAARIVPRLDEALTAYRLEENPPEGLPLLALRAWRNQAAQLAGFPRKDWKS